MQEANAGQCLCCHLLKENGRQSGLWGMLSHLAALDTTAVRGEAGQVRQPETPLKWQTRIHDAGRERVRQARQRISWLSSQPLHPTCHAGRAKEQHRPSWQGERLILTRNKIGIHCVG